MIHEELLYYPQMGLRKVIDLGAEWCWRNALPLPVGLNVICRNLGSTGMQAICGAIASSLQHARTNPEPTLARVSRFGRGTTGGCTEQFVEMFANDDSQHMPADVRSALGVLFSQAIALNGIPMPPIDIVEPATEVAAVS